MELLKVDPLNVSITKCFVRPAGKTRMYLCYITARIEVGDSKCIPKYMVESNTKFFNDWLEPEWGKYVDGYRESSIYIYSSNLKRLRLLVDSRVEAELDVLRGVVAVNRERLLGGTVLDVEEETYEL